MSVHNTKDEHTVVYVYHETLYNSTAYRDMDISHKGSVEPKKPNTKEYLFMILFL